MIKVLDSSLINKIAAGEVVERPASVVKELCENALDAGATAVTVEIEGGGLSFIRVTDNGSGIDAGEAESAFLRHATSKLQDADGLHNITTLGFRGEALSSIAAVSMTELTTKTADAEDAIKLTVHGGVLLGAEETAAPTGTSITVKNLFYNTPVRRKFLKKPSAEGGYVADVVTRLALGRPETAFAFITDGATVFATKGGSLREACLTVYGVETAGKLMDVDFAAGNVHITGFTGKPELSRGNRQMGHFYINRRHIKNHVMQSAVEAAYRTRLMTGRFPVFILNVELPAELVDVNVHPAKLEVRFHRDVDIYRLVYNAVFAALGGHLVASGAAAAVSAVPAKQNPLYVRERYTPPPDLPPFAAKSEPEGPAVNENFLEYATSGIISELDDLTYIYIPNADNPSPAPPKPRFRIVGQFFGTYWLIEAENDVCYLLDQHAAHERLLYDEITAELASGGATGQVILPVSVSLTSREKAAVVDNLALLKEMGFEVEEHPSGVVVRAVPYIFQIPANSRFFMDVVDGLLEDGSGTDGRADRVKSMACKAAVKARDALSGPEAQSLVERAMALGPDATCPHGRPVMVPLTKREVEKLFKRIV